MFRQDAVSSLFIVLGVLLTLALAVWGASFNAIFIPLFLLSGAVILRVYSIRHRRGQTEVPRDTNITSREGQQILVFTLFALAGMAVGNLFVEGLFTPSVPASILALSLPMATVLFSVDMAIAETQFFQGELLVWLHQNTKIFAVALVLSSLIGVFYHLNVYGTNPQALGYVFVGYTMLSWASWKTRRILPAMLAHIINNLGAWVWLSPFLILLLALSVFVFYNVNRRKNLWQP